ncbi:response regulator transcription factor [Rhizobium sp. YJ-22]|uniref:response regulator n=1 Tax=Rhizobium sp. YJ-22 TaxID=3037556 RepID=UPI00241264F0|nr:response regulator transcription factor [Rhizobium sp. YJ-22]MDG3579894.1 response regulator transcription factor [Rhizobium sp. YJ-22]
MMTGEEREPLRVAIVDDHPMFRMGVVRGLEDEGGIVIVAEGANAGDAISIYQRARPDISLLDLSMPGGGHAAIRGIRDLDGDASIVVLTASEDDNDVFEALKAGAKGYVLKGVDAGFLVSVLRRVAGGDTIVSPGLASRVLSQMTDRPASASQTGDGQARASLPRLTPREEQILALVAEGYSNKEVARFLSLQEKSIKHVMTRILKKLEVRNRTEAALLMREWQHDNGRR